ncbi:sugar transferase [Candidatus Gracilibacteria bacterium]|nr:sugar transferase [Candidatus Gracilibacteria bacterium]
MKHHELTFSAIKIPLDFFVIFFSFFLAKQIRLISDGIPGLYLPVQTIDTGYLSVFAIFGSILYITLFASHHLYSLQISHSKVAELGDIVRYSIYWFLFFSVGVYLGNGIVYSGAEIPRLIIVFTTILAMFGSMSVRIILNFIQSSLLQNNIIAKRNILLVSNKSETKMSGILKDISASKIYNIVGYANSSPNENISLKFYDGISKIEKLISHHKCDEILYIDSDFNKKELYRLWELSRIYGVRYRYITNNFDITKTNTTLSLINQTPVIEIQNTPLENWGRILKRVFDIFASLFILIITFPFWIIIAIFIKYEDSEGPVIYKNRRIGQNGIIFNCFKFRYLKWKFCIKESYGTENETDPAIEIENNLIKNQSKRNGPLYKIHEDPRKTKIGTFLEKYSLDELPQFLNVLTGEMSIVGPRPHQPREVQKYEQYQQRLLTVKPGITGMAQVNGREENNFVKEAELDIFYIENWSFILDLKIMLKTLSVIFNRK